VGSEADDATIRAYAEAAERAGVVIAEVGVWNNPLSPDEQTRRTALGQCQENLALADKIGARCCVNISGSLGPKWDGPYPDDLNEKTLGLITETVQTIIDAVNPTRTFYALETMPWMYPDSAESYLGLIKAINRRQFGVHFDPANLICSPQRFFGSTALMRDFFAKLGPHIRSCHGKDVIMSDKFIVHIDETCPGLGKLDYGVFLSELNKLDQDTPLMLEHLKSAEEYSHAASHVRSVASRMGIKI
jgi:sugar phosphate isomerase/epimerase